MSNLTDGGPAFPVKIDGPNNAFGLQIPAGKTSQFHGMTLRDYFAGQALANPKLCSQDAAWDHNAKWAYEAADAMLAERAKGGGA